MFRLAKHLSFAVSVVAHEGSAIFHLQIAGINRILRCNAMEIGKNLGTSRKKCFPGLASNKSTCYGNSKGKMHPCTGTEALYRPYGP